MGKTVTTDTVATEAAVESKELATEASVAVETNSEKTDNGPEMVKIKLFKDNANYNDDVFVSVNGRNFQIKRGVEVDVPVYVAEVLRNSEEQDKRTALIIEQSTAVEIMQ